MEFTRNLGLAETASRDRNPIFSFLGRADGLIAVFEAFVFIMAFGRDGSGRAAIHANLAGLI